MLAGVVRSSVFPVFRHGSKPQANTAIKEAVHTGDDTGITVSQLVDLFPVLFAGIPVVASPGPGVSRTVTILLLRSLSELFLNIVFAFEILRWL